MIDKGEGYIITSNTDGIQILMWNFAYYDTLYKTGDESALDRQNRYDVFEDKKDLSFEIDIQIASSLIAHSNEIPDTITDQYKVIRSVIGRNAGSALDNWVGMGAPDELSEDDIDYLKRVSVPRRSVDIIRVKAGNTLKLSARLPVHGVELIEIIEQYK